MQTNKKANLNYAPVLAEIFRGKNNNGEPIIECVYHGLIAVVDGDGESIFSAGDVNTPVHMRSCAKPFQVLPLLEIGYFSEGKDRTLSQLQLADLALLMSSHIGSAIHTSRVAELLDMIGLDPTSLRCGVHPPLDENVRRHLAEQKKQPSVLHNNCSGKHVAMLMACLKKQFDLSTYEDSNHPLQIWIKNLIAKIADLKVESINSGIDGCSLPSLVIPIKNLALLYARLAFWQQNLATDNWLKAAFSKIWTAAVNYPQYIAGEQRFDTELMRAGHQTIFCKSGADGLVALAIMPCEKFPKGLGIAIKIADGDAKQTIRPVVVKRLLEILQLWPNNASLERFNLSFKNLRGLVTGGINFTFGASGIIPKI